MITEPVVAEPDDTDPAKAMLAVLALVVANVIDAGPDWLMPPLPTVTPFPVILILPVDPLMAPPPVFTVPNIFIVRLLAPSAIALLDKVE